MTFMVNPFTLFPVAAGVPADYTAYYTMDNVSGATVFDESANSYDLTTVNTPTFTTGQVGNEIQTNGTTQYAKSATISAIASDTVGTVVYIVNASVGSSGSNRGVISIGNTSGASAMMFRIGTTNKAQMNFTNIVANGDTTVTTGYHLLTFSSSGSSYQVTVDAVEQTLSFSTGTNNGNWINNQVTSNPQISIGRLERSDGPFYYQSGVDEALYYNRQLSLTEISGIYDAFFP